MPSWTKEAGEASGKWAKEIEGAIAEVGRFNADHTFLGTKHSDAAARPAPAGEQTANARAILL